MRGWITRGGVMTFDLSVSVLAVAVIALFGPLAMLAMDRGVTLAVASGWLDRPAGAAVHLASDDGSVGHKGFVTQLLESHGRTGPLVGCGPEPMLHALKRLAAKWGVLCQVSLETPMACGVGICFSCVTPVKKGDGWDYSRVCIDGPVFDASCLR